LLNSSDQQARSQVAISDERRFAAFVSYRQIKSDMAWARWLHRALETYRIPKELVPKGSRNRLGLIFRDVEELETVHSLDEAIKGALNRSRYLIVICSPESRQSEWIEREVSYFLSLDRRSRILLFLIRGRPDSSFPKLLVTPEPLKPAPEALAADVRGAAGISAYNRRHAALLKIVAAILGCSLDHLVQRDRRRRKRRIGFGVLAALILTLGAAFQLAYSIDAEIYALSASSGDVLQSDPQLSLLLGRVGFAKSNRYLGIGRTRIRSALEQAIVASRLRARFDSHDTWLRGLSWHASGWIAVGGGNGVVTTWNRKSQEYGSTLNPGGNVDRLSFSPSRDVRRLSIVDWHETLRIWNVETNTVVELRRRHDSNFTANHSDVAWCPRNSDLAATSDGVDNVLIFDIKKPQEPPAQFADDKFGIVNSVTWSPDCQAL